MNEMPLEGTFQMNVILLDGMVAEESNRVRHYLDRGWRIQNVRSMSVLNRHIRNCRVTMERMAPGEGLGAPAEEKTLSAKKWEHGRIAPEGVHEKQRQSH